MGKTKAAVLCVAAALSGKLLTAPAPGFVVARQASALSADVEQHLLGAESAVAPSEAGLSRSTLAASVGLGLVAVGLAAVRRQAPSKAARSAGPVFELKPVSKFAGGLTGSEYHGWGTYEWDPLELSARYPEHLAWYRESELKHGRIAMFAFLGLLVPDVVRIPLSDFESADLDFVNAHNKLIYGLGQGPMWWLLIFCGVIESLRFKQLGLAFEKLTLENAGDLGFGKAFLPKTPEGIKQLEVKELKNGRLAMLAVSGALTQGVVWNVHHFPFQP